MVANERLLSKTAELDEANRSLFESNHELAEINKELADTNKRFALTNKHFAELNKKLTRITKELALSNKTIEQQNKTQLEFINIAAHELRTPIMPVIAGLELLEERLSLIPKEKKVRQEMKQDIDIINRNALRLKKLAEDILQVSRIEGGAFRINMQGNVNIIAMILEVINDIKQNYQHIGKQDKVSISFTSLDHGVGQLFNGQDEQHQQQELSDSRKSLLIQCDAEKIQQVMFNLLHNAMKFTGQGVIKVAVKRTSHDERGGNNDSVIVSIKDQGTGIDPSIRDKLFEKFATKSTNGAGLGLYLSRKIIEAHGGKIWIERNIDRNEDEDERGALFAFSLPIKNNQGNKQ